MTIASVDLSGMDFTGYAAFFAVILALIACKARPGCVQAAKDRGLRGSERSAHVKRCIQAAVDDE